MVRKLETFELADALDRFGLANAGAVARGAVLGLIDLAAERAPAGDVGRMTDRTIARACGVGDDAACALIAALIETAWLVRDDRHRLLVGDWWERADDAVHMAMARARGFFADGRAPKLSKLGGDERREIAAWYAAHVVRTNADGAQLAFFSSESEEAEAEREKRGERERGERAARVRTAPRALVGEERIEPAWREAREAFAKYGQHVDERLAGARRTLALRTLADHPDRPHVLAELVHGYMALRGQASARWDPLAHLVPETVWKPRHRVPYLEAFDRAHRARAPIFDADRARERWAAACLAYEHALGATGEDAARIPGFVDRYRQRGLREIASGNARELHRLHEEIDHEIAAMRGARASA